jgi:hypothetical protein
VLRTYLDQTDSTTATANRVIWDPPFEDANDVIIKAICTRDVIEPIAGIPADERRARFKKQRWSDILNSTTHSNAYEVVHPKGPGSHT